jgi:hypothetical protein
MCDLGSKRRKLSYRVGDEEVSYAAYKANQGEIDQSNRERKWNALREATGDRSNGIGQESGEHDNEQRSNNIGCGPDRCDSKDSPEKERDGHITPVRPDRIGGPLSV